MAMLIPEAWDDEPAHEPEEEGVLRISRVADGAVGRAGGGRVHRWPRRSARRSIATACVPARYLVTNDDLVIMASETGVLPVQARGREVQGPAAAGQDAAGGPGAGPHRSRRRDQAQLAAARKPYGEWMKENQITLDQLPEPPRVHGADHETHATPPARVRLHRRRHADVLMTPMAVKGEEPIGSMGTDTPLACLSDKPQPLFNYFKQLFAQVTNPPIDPIREEMVMSLTSYIGTERNILDETPQHCHTLKLPHPILTNRDLEKLRRVSQGDFLATTLPMLFRVEDGEEGLERALDAALPPRVAGDQVGLHAADSFRPRRGSKTMRPFRACWR